MLNPTPKRVLCQTVKTQMKCRKGRHFSRERKKAKIRNRYNQVPHLSHDTKWDSNEITINITNKSQEVSTFPSGDHKAAITKLKAWKHGKHKIQITHIIRKISTTLEQSVKYFTRGLKPVYGTPT